MNVKKFVDTHFRHFNAGCLRDAAQAYDRHLRSGGGMVVSLAGAMSTAELGRSLAEMIRKGKVHCICCTGANLEEDLFNLVAHEDFHRIPDWRNLTPSDDRSLEASGMNRVTDTCIPEGKAIRIVEKELLRLWRQAEERGDRFFPHEFLYSLLRNRRLLDRYQIDPEDSWLVAASERDLPIFVPGWEDSTLGNIFVSHVISENLSDYGIVRSGLEAMSELASFYLRWTTGSGEVAVQPETDRNPRPTLGLFQIGGGIAGDFPICVVPMIRQDLGKECPYWGYFCQISDSTTSYGSYSGAFPSEKISWGKLDVETPSFVIESDATIVAPILFAYVLGW